MGWFGLLVPLVFVGAIVGLRWNAVRLTRKIEAPSVVPTITFSGGFWSRVTGGTRNYRARLEFFDWGIRLRGIRPGGFLLPVYEIRYQELTDVQPVATRLRNGVRLRSDVLPAPMNFETYADAVQRIVAQFEDRGVVV